MCEPIAWRDLALATGSVNGTLNHPVPAEMVLFAMTTTRLMDVEVHVVCNYCAVRPTLQTAMQPEVL